MAVDLMKVDFTEAGSIGPNVMLVHSSAAGARQWRKLTDDLKTDFRVRAINLYGYGNSPHWPTDVDQTLDDQADLVEAALQDLDGFIYLVGHSFGGSVAMKTAARLGPRVTKLVLLETNPFYLLAQSQKMEAFDEALALHNCVKACGRSGNWMTAAETFADYWNGVGTWQAMSQDRRSAFAKALQPNFSEWDAVLNETTPANEWARSLPPATLQIVDPNTVRPIYEISQLLRIACPHWEYVEVQDVGYMAPVTRPDVINPIVRHFLEK